ncbi:MAG: hypothetical protein ACE5IQ_11715 [Candidatus Methylomirabilales bacterium]
MGQHRPLPFWRRRFYVHPIQRKYFFLFLVPLIVCAFLVIFLAFIPLHLGLRGPGSELEKAAILGQIYALSVTIWPAFLISMLACGILSFFITHKFAGPLYRIEQILRRGQGGDLPSSVRIRSDDDLQELVQLLDGTFKKFASTLIAIHEQHGLASKELSAVRGKVRAQSNGEMLEGLEGIGRNLKEVQNILANFKIPIPPSINPKPRE